ESNPITPGSPTANADAIFPLASIRTPEGVPFAPIDWPTANFSSSSTADSKPIARLASREPPLTRTNRGAVAGLFCSHSFNCGIIFWQNPQPGFQNNKTVPFPLKLADSTDVPFKSGSVKAGTIEPIGNDGFGGGGCGGSARAVMNAA